jgi:hypothetical protein
MGRRRHSRRRRPVSPLGHDLHTEAGPPRRRTPKKCVLPRRLDRGPIFSSIALERAEELANALVHGLLDDVDLSSLERQRAAVTALEQTFPLQAMTVEVELPAEASSVAAMGWEEMQQLAGRVLELEVGTGGQGSSEQ